MGVLSTSKQLAGERVLSQSLLRNPSAPPASPSWYPGTEPTPPLRGCGLAASQVDSVRCQRVLETHLQLTAWQTRVLSVVRNPAS